MGGMSGLPAGTVSLLFSDVEGSTALLSRLGSAYGGALDAQRRILREAWTSHGGTELGTEGDSFFVAFETARSAVAAAVAAQRELALFDWPAGDRVRVRMGIHTGAPMVHDGGYVGMDVHRAARIAGVAHGGQVLVSQATAGLVAADLTDGVGLRDLGRHKLKDLVSAEHLFQLDIAGLEIEFAAVRSLGAASSLPVPATSLVGRDGELAELAALLSSPGVRLVTLTGPGGSGKTRLGVGLARRLVGVFADGVYFVPLAAATTPEVMWTSIGEGLDVPPEGRMPPGFFTHVAHRSALFVLDNLEQLPDADAVVSQLLAEAPQVVVVATSRRPLHVAGEHEHPVPTLELPDRASLEHTQRSPAVQMFVQHAQMVRPSFALTEANADAVAQVCRRLDGLPLAIELAAARTKLLSPAALVTRLDSALELRDTGVDRPHRQQTLRDTIAWSYQLLDPIQQAFFRRLGVFSGGADLAAIAAVTADDTADDTADSSREVGSFDPSDPLDLVADMVDASLATITEEPAGEPRIGLLETIRLFALGELQRTGELDDRRALHAHHYAGVADRLGALMHGGGDDLLAARRGLELELDNFREALRWALQPDGPRALSDRVQVGVRLCSSLDRLWWQGGYFAEGRRWLELAIDRSGDQDSRELAYCLHDLACLCSQSSLLERGIEAATRSVAMFRRLGDKEGLSLALSDKGWLQASFGHLPAARRAAEEAVSPARDHDARYQLANALAILAQIECFAHNLERARELVSEALDIGLELGDEDFTLICRGNLACTLRELGRVKEAHALFLEVIPLRLRFPIPDQLMDLADDYGAIRAELGQSEHAARLLGAADAMRERHALPRRPAQVAEIEEPFAKARRALGEASWRREYQRGREVAIEEVLAEEFSVSRD
jgi:predicted ATPase/class 3 adenylate cyclase